MLMKTKVCIKCKIRKPKDRFTNNLSSKDGKYSYCMNCEKLKQRENYKNHPNLYKQTVQRWAKRNPEKIKAHGVMNYALLIGAIIKPKVCQRCGKRKRLDAHHWKGYNKKYHLSVLWLCRKCHKKEESISV